MNKVPYVITTCWLLGSVNSAPQFGVDFTPSTRVENTGIGETSQDSQVIQLQRQQHPNFHFERNNLFSNGDETEDSFNPIPVGSFDKIKPHQPSEINKFNQEINKFSDTRSPIKYDHGPDSDDYPAEILEDETTTVDPLNRQGYPPAVLASLLGSG